VFVEDTVVVCEDLAVPGPLRRTRPAGGSQLEGCVTCLSVLLPAR
jgi:hypothetical protein